VTVDVQKIVTQDAFALLVGISQPAVSDLLSRAVLRKDAPLGEWLLAYCSHLREQAAGRASTGDLQLAAERARLASEQADRVAMLNAERRRELAPVSLLELVLSRVCRQITGILETLPIQLRRQSTALTTEDLSLIEREIVKVRNLAASVELKLTEDEDGSFGDPQSDPLRAEAA
jgi:terminase small subunit / prophage DNA-packing protein